ncbi:MAG: hypothetical protein AB1714_25610 [Acidobacteriota bacterium]
MTIPMRTLLCACSLSILAVPRWEMVTPPETPNGGTRKSMNVTESCGRDYYQNGRGERPDHIRLDSLADGYEIQIGVLSPVDAPEFIYLVDRTDCTVVTRIESPQDLAGYVTIASPASCLEYLRFFSLPETYALTGNDYVEIFSADTSHAPSSCWNFVEPVRWRHHTIPSVQVRSTMVRTVCKAGDSADSRAATGFAIVRPTLWSDNKVFLVTEEVSETGLWRIQEKQDLGLTGDDLGILFMFWR